MAYLKMSGKDLSKYIQALTISHEPTWNSKAGRTITAEFVGRIVARKWKLQFTTIPLSQKVINEILSLLEKSDFFDVEFIPINNAGGIIKRTFYVNAPSVQVYSYNDQLSNVRYQSLQFNIIEK